MKEIAIFYLYMYRKQSHLKHKNILIILSWEKKKVILNFNVYSTANKKRRKTLRIISIWALPYDLEKVRKIFMR